MYSNCDKKDEIFKLQREINDVSFVCDVSYFLEVTRVVGSNILRGLEFVAFQSFWKVFWVALFRILYHLTLCKYV